MLCSVCNVSLDRAARCIGPQDPQWVITGSDGLLGHGAGMILLRRIHHLVFPDGM